MKTKEIILSKAEQQLLRLKRRARTTEIANLHDDYETQKAVQRVINRQTRIEKAVKKLLRWFPRQNVLESCIRQDGGKRPISVTLYDVDVLDLMKAMKNYE